MRFEHLQILNLLWFVPVLAWVLWLIARYRLGVMDKFIQARLLDQVAVDFSRRRVRLKNILMAAVFVFVVLALARPQWGYQMQTLKRQGLDIAVAVDTSKSMMTQDVRPSRLERTKLAVKDLIKKLQGDRIGLIAFAGESFVMCPLTVDYSGFLMSIDDLSIGSIPRGGTNLSKAIEEGLKLYEGGALDAGGYKTMILVTDGEEEEGDALSAARKAKEKNVRIYTVGIGTKEGDLIQVPDASGAMSFLKDAQGNFIKSRLNENLLQQIAYVTGGAYVRSSGAQSGLDFLYDTQLSKLQKRDISEQQEKKFYDRFQWFLGIALILLLWETLLGLSFPPSIKTFEGKLQRESSFWMPVFTGMTILLFTNSAWASPANDVREGTRLYRQGKIDAAVEHYQKALGKAKDSALVNFDLGTALYKKGDYAAAIESLQKAAAAKDKDLNVKAQYNLGNALYKSGLQKEDTNIDEAIKTMQQALGSYQDVKTHDAKDADAQYNYQVVQKKLEELKQKKQEQQKQQQQQKEQDKKDQDKKDQDKKDQQDQKNQQDQQGQQNKQDQKDQSQQQQQEQTKQPPEQKQQKEQDAAAKAQDASKEQAQNILQDYERNEQPKGLLNFIERKDGETPVSKDW